MSLDNTYSISGAVLALEKRQQRKRQRPQPPVAEDPMDDGPVDIVAVVSGVATLNSTLAASPMVATAPRVDLRIIDPSIPSNAVAKVSLHGSMEVARIAEEQISPGDILRFNRLRLGRHHHPQDSQDSNEVDRDNLPSASATIDEGGPGDRFGNHNTLLHFEASIDDPDPDFRWFKLGRIRMRTTDDDYYHGLGDPMIPTSSGGADNGSGRPRAILSDDRRRASNFPQEMMTADSRIKELLAWYPMRGLRSRHGSTTTGSSEIASSGHEKITGPSSMAEISVVADRNVRSLSPLPCKRRSLAEMQASSGLLSNLVVRVTHYDSQVIPLQSTTRRSGSGVPPEPVRQCHVVGFGLVTDSSGVVMSFVDPGDRFGSYLRAGAEDPTKSIMMTHVTSKKQRKIFGRPLVSEEVVLWPTKQTTVSIMLDHGLSNDQSNDELLLIEPIMMVQGVGGIVRGDDRDQHGSALVPPAWPGGVTASSFSDRSPRVRIIGGDDDSADVMLGQQAFETTHQETQDINTFLDDLVLMESSINDILVNGLSLRRCLVDWSPVDLQANLLTSDGQEYSPVLIRLAMKSNATSQDDISAQKYDGKTMMASLQQGESSLSSSLFHTAGSSVVQALCGGVAPMEWKVDTTTRGGEREEEEQQQRNPNDQDDERRSSSVAKNKNDPGGDDEPTRTMTRSDEEGPATSLGWKVLRLLRALLYEDVVLTWKIDVHHDPPRVDSVFLSSF